MESKKKATRKKKATGPVDVKSLGLSDLLALHTFVTGDSNRVFGPNQRGKLLVKGKLTEVETELYARIYGENPFMSAPVEGVNPISVDLSQFDDDGTKPQTFVIAGNTNPEE